MARKSSLSHDALDLDGPAEEAQLLGRLGILELVEPRMRQILRDHLGVGDGELVALTSLRDDLGTDSLDVLELALLIEKEFGISISEARWMPCVPTSTSSTRP